MLTTYVTNTTSIKKKINPKYKASHSLNGIYGVYFKYRSGSNLVSVVITKCSFWLAQKLIECSWHIRKRHLKTEYSCELDVTHNQSLIHTLDHVVKRVYVETNVCGLNTHKTKVLVSKGIFFNYE